MKNRGFVYDKKGPWGQVTVYSDSVVLRPSITWVREKRIVMRRMLRGRKPRDYEIENTSPQAARSLLARAMRGKWYVLPKLRQDRSIEALNEHDVEQVLTMDLVEPWRIDRTILWMDRTHDGHERHFSLDSVLEAQRLYDNGNILELKILIVDALAIGNQKFAYALSRCVSDRIPSGSLIQPMDLFAFWADDGNIFAHTAFGEKIRLFKPEETNVATSTGFMYWKDFKTHSRRSALSALKQYF